MTRADGNNQVLKSPPMVLLKGLGDRSSRLQAIAKNALQWPYPPVHLVVEFGN